MELFGLADCNNFYCSCERVFHPDLRNKPVMVLSNNDGCIIDTDEKQIKTLKFFEISDVWSVVHQHGMKLAYSNICTS